jgi:hypothetical protein
MHTDRTHLYIKLTSNHTQNIHFCQYQQEYANDEKRQQCIQTYACEYKKIRISIKLPLGLISKIFLGK